MTLTDSHENDSYLVNVCINCLMKAVRIETLTGNKGNVKPYYEMIIKNEPTFCCDASSFVKWKVVW